MSCDNCPETIGNPDPYRMIYNWCTNVPVPRWVGEKAYKNCYHCGDNFKSGKQHHCRLCGEMFCSRCTGKYNIPPKYELKGKDGPTRVCYQCKNTCIQKRQLAEGTRPFRLTSSFCNPDWQALASYVSCEKCRKKEKNPHNCRLCGFLSCDTCTSKIDIVLPLEYNKKNKPGPHRVCDECRYRYKAGAQIRGINDPPSPESRYLDAEAMRASKSKNSTPISSLQGTDDLSDRLNQLSLETPPVLNLNDVDSDGDIPAPPPRAASTDKAIITVKRAGKSTPMAVLEVSSDGSLEDVHNSLLLKCPELRNKNIQLIVRGEPVSKSHWDIFKARHCRGEVLVSEVGLGPIRVLGPSASSMTAENAATRTVDQDDDQPKPRPPTTVRPGSVVALASRETDFATKHRPSLEVRNEEVDENDISDAENANVLNIDNASTSAFAQAVFNSRNR